MGLGAIPATLSSWERPAAVRWPPGKVSGPLTPPPPRCCIVAPQVWGTHAMTWWKSERSFCVACRYSTVLACLLSSPSQAMLPACKDAKGG